jgi:hypothetical protein
MSKRTYTVTVEGQTYSRTSTRNYTHVVYLQGYGAANGGQPTNYTGVQAWCGSEVLANKQARTWANYLKGVEASVLPVDA